MARAVSLFSGYSQKENRVTNYTLLVLKMLYEENPKTATILPTSLTPIRSDGSTPHSAFLMLRKAKRSQKKAHNENLMIIVFSG
jgi:hypothetical protein